MTQPAADRDLLFGVLALNTGLITEAQLLTALQELTRPAGAGTTPSRRMPEILLQSGQLRPRDAEVLELLLRGHLERNADLGRLLDVVGSLAPASVALARAAGLTNHSGSVRSTTATLVRKNDTDEPRQQSAEGATLGTMGGMSAPAIYPSLPSDEPGASAPRDGERGTSAPRDREASDPPRAGSSRYRVVRPHASGGLGEVFVAHDQELQREVALKEIKARHAADKASRQRFLLEAEVTGQLEHPGIVPVYGLGTYADGRPYYAMRFIRGEPLSKAIQRFHHNEERKHPQKRAAELRGLLKRFQNICDAVAFAHSKGIIHRDLKPDNVILGQYGETLVIDWGLAKAVGTTEERVGGDTLTVRLSGTDVDATHTRIGDVLGTPSFMPPEQAAGRLDELGPAADIYSLGATLYVILVGRSPVEGANVSEVLERARNGRITPPRQANPAVPAALEAVCLKAMARKPQDRYASAKELSAEVDCWLADEPVSAYQEPVRVRLARWRRRHPALVTGTAALLFTALLSVAVGAWLLSQEQDRTLTEHKARLRAQGAEIESQKNTEKARQDHALAQVDALFSASPGAVPPILESLEPFRERVLPRLREVLDRPVPAERTPDAIRRDRQHRTRAALAMLKDDAGQVPFLVRRMLEAQLDPEETLLIRDQLAAHGKELAPQLWEEARKPGAGPERRLRALVALAAFDPDEKRWANAGKDVVGPLLAAEPLHVGVWRKGLEPVRRHLIAPLTEAFVAPTGTRSRWSPAERRMATGLLRDYAQDDVATLAALILTADAEQFVALLPAFRSHGEKAVALMHRELERSVVDWKDSPLDPRWATPSAEVIATVEQAQGLVAERFALCQTLSFEDLKPVTESLRGCGYRPTRVRPYGTGRAVQVAVVWQRDGRDWWLDVGLTAEEAKERQDQQKKEDYLPADVAGYRTRGEVRYAVLWVKAASRNEDAGLYVGVPYERHAAEQEVYKKQGFMPFTLQALAGSEPVRYSGVWGKGEARATYWSMNWNQSTPMYREKVDNFAEVLVDVDLVPGNVAGARGKTVRELLDAAEEAVTAKPEEASALYHRGQMRHRAGKDKEALEDLDAIVKRFPSFAEGYHFRALVLARLGRATEAKEDLGQFLKLSDTAVRKAPVEVLILTYLGDRNAAMRRLEQAIAAAPKDSYSLSSLARIPALILADLPRQRSLVQAREVAAGWAALAAPSLSPWGLAPLTAQLGRQRETLTADEKSLAKRSLSLLQEAVDLGYDDIGTLQTDLDFESLRSRPEFAALLRRGQLDRRYSAVSQTRPLVEGAEASGLGVEGQLRRCRELAGQDYRPVGLSVTRLDDGQLATASVWHRPAVTAVQRDRLARRQANAACALLHLGKPERARPLLVHSRHPDARSHLIHRLGPLKVEGRLVIDRLLAEKDVSVRRALILSLGEYTAEQLPSSERRRVLPALLEWYEKDPDPGIHSAVDWLLRHAKEGPDDRKLAWGQAKALQQRDRLREEKPATRRRWFVNDHGHTFAVLDGSKEFLMGSPVHETGHHGGEVLHRRRIGRTFAIATREVTVAQFQEFLKANPQVRFYASPEDAAGTERPQTGLSWYDAAMYCRWLSEQEGIPEDQMCYPPIPEILKCADGLTPLRLPPDHLSRKGYRLPTEAEWEFASRAGADGPRYYGDGDDLLPAYAWFIHNSHERTWPVGQKKPNDFGLFDTLGNAFECCQGTYRAFRPGTRGRPAGDEEDRTPMTDRVNRVMRGGSYTYTAANQRAASRLTNRPPARLQTDGFRIARTCDPPETQPSP